MAKLIELPSRNTLPRWQKNPSVPDYTGRKLTINPEKSTRFVFYCGGFMLGPRRPIAVVESDAQMDQIHRAVEEGRLLDVTAGHTVQTEYTQMADIRESDTDKKAYLIPARILKTLPLNLPDDINREDLDSDGSVMFMTEDPKEKKLLDEVVSRKTVPQVPPGMDDPDKYLLKV